MNDSTICLLALSDNWQHLTGHSDLPWNKFGEIYGYCWEKNAKSQLCYKFALEFYSRQKLLCFNVERNKVIWKHELYFLILLRNCFQSLVIPINKFFRGNFDWSNSGRFTFPLTQHIPKAFHFNFIALQCRQTLSIFPIWTNFHMKYCVEYLRHVKKAIQWYANVFHGQFVLF